MIDNALIATSQNPNMIWAEILVDELAQGGLREVCIAPGSRSTPLALAFYANPQIRIFPHLDERSASFFALGLALVEDRPVALLCTSGTAGANFYPAIIEANMSQVPLLVLTADRPHELRHSGANQTIDQTKMFVDHVLWSIDMALPEEKPPELAIRNLRTVAARALALSDGLRKGPVHLNFPFRKPLEPSAVESWNDHERYPNSGRDLAGPLTTIERGTLMPSLSQVEVIVRIIEDNPRGLIVCGPRCAAGDFPEAVGQLARISGYPILADTLSGVRFGAHVTGSQVCGAYETFLHSPDKVPDPDLVIRFGAVPTSKRLNTYLAKSASAQHIHVRENGVWADQSHRTTLFIQVDPLSLCRAIVEGLTKRKRFSWLDNWMAMEARCWSRQSERLDLLQFDGAYVAELLSLLPDNSAFFAGNSLPIRHVDQYAQPTKKSIQVYANRGASGIDGNISTGLGIAAGSGLPTTILIGDITFYHDSNGLLALKNASTVNLTIVVLNNNGGGIFQRLPVAQFEPPFEQLFRVPPDLDISSMARTYGMEYTKCSSKVEFAEIYQALHSKGKARLIEIQTEPERDEQMRRELELYAASG